MQHYKKPVQHYVDPLSKTALYYLLSKEIKKLNRMIEQGECRTLANRVVNQTLQAALYSPDQNLVYPVYDEGLPCFLIDRALPGPEFEAHEEINDIVSDLQPGPGGERSMEEIDRLKSVLGSALSINQGDNHSRAHNKLAFLAGYLGGVSDTGFRVLDIGIGHGQVVENCCNLGHTVCGVDLRPERAKSTYERLKVATSYSDGDFQLCIADARHLPFPDAAFDAVLADFVQQAPDRIAPALSESARVTKNDNPLLAGFAVESRLLKPLKHKDKLSELPYTVKVMMSVLSGAGLTPFWWVYGMAKASDTFRHADMRILLKDAAIYSYSVMFNVREDYLYPRQLVELFRDKKLVRQSSYESVQIGTNRWFLLKKI